MITVSEIMSDQVIKLTSTDTVSTAKEIMRTEGIRHIPIVDEHSLPIGLITQRDILRVQDSDLAANNIPAIDEKSVLVEQIMSRKIASVHPGDSLRSAGIRMQKNKYGCLPVIQENQLVGIITDTDFVGVAIDLIEQMELHEDF